MRFIDLFAGLGGFHLALKQLGNKCVFASEIDNSLRKIYETNFGMMPHGDIRKIKVSQIPEHDIMCAGFPCQPFSKAGRQDGLRHPELGGLYKDIIRIIRYHQPKFILLENVPNLQNHNNGKTWNKIEKLLRSEKYDVALRRLSPHHFGIPQIRERIYIIASKNDLSDFRWPKTLDLKKIRSVKEILDKNPSDSVHISTQVKKCLSIWQDFLKMAPHDENIPHPLWSMEFGATYPYEKRPPSSFSAKELRRFKGSHGKSLRSFVKKSELIAALPSYARSKQKFPKWKVDYIRKNRDFYSRHHEWLDKWMTGIMPFPSSYQKLEWNCQGEKNRQLKRYIIQFRASGVRVKRPTTSPSLVAMTATQVPIITWEKRYMTIRECQRLQSMDELDLSQLSREKAYQALGNAINVDVARNVAQALIGHICEKYAKTNLSINSIQKIQVLR